VAAQTAVQDRPGGGGVREREIAVEQEHLDRVYRRLEEKIHEVEFLMSDAAQRGHVGTPGALAERDAQVYRASVHLNRLNSEFEDFLFGRIDLLLGKDGKKGADGAYTSVDPADDAIRADATADIAETLHIGRIGVLDSDYSPLVVDWRAPAAAPFYRSTPVAPGRVVRRRVIRSKGRRVLGVEDDLLRPELRTGLPVVGDGALMAALGQARTHSMRDIVASIQAEQDLVIRAPAASVTEVTGGPGTGKTAVALHRAAYLLYQDRRRYSGGILIVSPTPLLVAYTEGVLPSLGEEGQVAIRAIGSLVDGLEAKLYDSPAVARAKGSYRMLKVLRNAARGCLELVPDAPETLRVVAFGRRVELSAAELASVRRTVLGGTAPVNLLRPRARRLLLDALWRRTGRRLDDAELAAEERQGFDEDVSTEPDFTDFLDAWWPVLDPRTVLAALADERRLSRWARCSAPRRGPSGARRTRWTSSPAWRRSPPTPTAWRAAGAGARSGWRRSVRSTRTSSSTRRRTSLRCSGGWWAAAAAPRPGRSSATRRRAPGRTWTRPRRPATRRSAPGRAAASASR
jgi:hypothetical protein